LFSAICDEGTRRLELDAQQQQFVHKSDRRKLLKRLAPQARLEPATLRLTA
jgi:hypothetical protein